MPWYYAKDNQRLGPISDSEFSRLAREGIVSEDTLVWQYGMKDWQPYAEVAPKIPPLPSETPPPLDPALRAAEILAALPEPLNYAGFWPRAGAKIVDWLILFGLTQGLTRLLGIEAIDPSAIAEGDMSRMIPLLQQLAVLAFADSAMRLAYYWVFMRRYAATPGKILLGLKVVRSDGSALSHGRIVGRFFGEVVSKYFTFCIGYLLAAFDEEKRALHDSMCDTRVIKSR